VSRSSATWADWAVGQTSPMYCRYLPSDEAGTKLYRLVTEAHVCEQHAQGCYLEVNWAKLEPATSGLQVRDSTVTLPSHSELSPKILL